IVSALGPLRFGASDAPGWPWAVGPGAQPGPTTTSKMRNERQPDESHDRNFGSSGKAGARPPPPVRVSAPRNRRAINYCRSHACTKYVGGLIGLPGIAPSTPV